MRFTELIAASYHFALVAASLWDSCADLPQGCHCFATHWEETFQIACSNTELASSGGFPTTLPENIVSLSFMNVSFVRPSKLDARTFQHKSFRRLKSLTLDHTDLAFLSSDLRQNLPHLQYLFITFNPFLRYPLQ